MDIGKQERAGSFFICLYKSLNSTDFGFKSVHAEFSAALMQLFFGFLSECNFFSFGLNIYRCRGMRLRRKC